MERLGANFLIADWERFFVMSWLELRKIKIILQFKGFRFSENRISAWIDQIKIVWLKNKFRTMAKNHIYPAAQISLQASNSILAWSFLKFSIGISRSWSWKISNKSVEQDTSCFMVKKRQKTHFPNLTKKHQYRYILAIRSLCLFSQKILNPADKSLFFALRMASPPPRQHRVLSVLVNKRVVVKPKIVKIT